MATGIFFGIKADNKILHHNPLQYHLILHILLYFLS